MTLKHSDDGVALLQPRRAMSWMRGTTTRSELQGAFAEREGGEERGELLTKERSSRSYREDSRCRWNPQPPLGDPGPAGCSDR